MQTGKIAKKMDKGFGFISRDGEEKDLFFHANELVGIEFDLLREGEEVTFEIQEGPKGLSAVEVRRAVDAQEAPKELDAEQVHRSA